MKLIDRYLVKVEQKQEAEFAYGSLVLSKPALSERIEGSNGKDCSYNPTQHLTKQGLVIEPPHKLSTTPARFINVGHPQNSRYISGEMIESSKGDLRKKDYNPSTYTDKSHKVVDVYRIEAKEGDLVHFYHTGIEFNDPISEDLYPINVSNIFAYERDGEVKVCFGFLLCKYIEKPSETEGGLLLIEEEKFEQNQGIVYYTNQASDIQPGERIYHRKLSDYAITIQGEDYFVVREYDCGCTII